MQQLPVTGDLRLGGKGLRKVDEVDLVDKCKRWTRWTRKFKKEIVPQVCPLRPLPFSRQLYLSVYGVDPFALGTTTGSGPEFHGDALVG